MYQLCSRIPFLLSAASTQNLCCAKEPTRWDAGPGWGMPHGAAGGGMQPPATGVVQVGRRGARLSLALHDARPYKAGYLPKPRG